MDLYSIGAFPGRAGLAGSALRVTDDQSEAAGLELLSGSIRSNSIFYSDRHRRRFYMAGRVSLQIRLGHVCLQLSANK